MQTEADEEALTLNMKAMASFLIHFHHIWLDGSVKKSKGRFWHGSDPLLGTSFALGDIADPLFLFAVGLSDRHAGNKPSVRDIGLGVIWMEYLWVFPALLKPVASFFNLGFAGGTGWFLLTLLYGRIALHILTALRAPPALQVGWMFACFCLISWFWEKPTYVWSGKEDKGKLDYWLSATEVNCTHTSVFSRFWSF